MSSVNDTNPLIGLSDMMADAVAKIAAATVTVDARRRFPASGIVYAAGMVLTADHVVEQDEAIRVMLPDGSETKAQVAGRDPGSDLAVLRLENGGAAAIAEAVSQEARVGQLAIAVGRPFPDGVQASLGIVSAIGGPARTGRGRLLEHYLRTDAVFYPGFSGGPLVNLAGQVIGLNTSGLARGTPLTIPAALAWQIADTLAQHGHVRRGYLGVRSQPVELPASQRQALGREQESGLLLVGIEEDGPAAGAGLLVGDILTAISGKPVTDPDELFVHLSGGLVGKPVPVEVLRGGKLTTVQVVVGERP